MVLKIAIAAVLIGGPILALIWIICTHMAHRGRMQAYDRMSKTFGNLGKKRNR